MLARVATFEHLPDDLDSKALRALRETVRHSRGYIAGFDLIDRRSGHAMSIIVMSDAQAATTIHEQLDQRAPHGTVGINPDHVRFFDAQTL